MGSYIALDIELKAIKNFLSKNLEAVDAEIAIICKRKEAGEFQNSDDFSNALFFPMQQEAIAIRAVFYEINALVKWGFSGLALEAYSKSPRYAETPKFLGDKPLDDIKFIFDLPIEELLRLIEQYYEINLSDIPGSTEVEYVQKAVNAFTDRKGFKVPFRDPKVKSSEQFQISRKDAYQTIDGARAFLRALPTLQQNGGP